ncbi:hypothetical protein ACG83_30790 [Frankia sp. R43]|nr:hypothetical protein [Frankia sp. R43]KPM51965.1 hypothetical protein ACG83_30790 [Frankia sp. R43]
MVANVASLDTPRALTACGGAGLGHRRAQRVGQIDRDLCILDPSSGADVLVLSTDSHRAVFEVAGLVGTEHRVGTTEVFGPVATQVGA